MRSLSWMGIRSAFRRGNTWIGAVALLTLVGAILRLFHLGRQSLWYDEAYSVYLASMTLREAAQWTARDVVPPLYYYLLHFWQGVFGASEVSVRALSALAGTLTIPLFYAVGKRLFGRLQGVVAAALIAISPLYIWYSQEARMYAPLTLFGLLAGWFLLKVLTAPTASLRRRAWVGFLVASTATTYTHTTGFFLMAFFAVAFLVAWGAWMRRRVVLAEGVAVAAAFAALHLPWIPVALKNLGVNRGFWEGVLGIQGVVRQVFASYWTGKTVFSQTADALVPVFAAIVVLGAAALAFARGREQASSEEVRLPRWFAIGFAALYSILPVALYVVLFYRTPKFDTRYLYLTSPGFFLLVGAGLVELLTWRLRGRRAVRMLGAAALLFLVGVFAYGDYNNYFDPRFQRDDFRDVAHYIKDRIGANETVILCSGHFFPAWQYYYGRDNWHPLPDEPILNVDRVLTFQAGDDLNRILKGKDGVWVVFWQDEVVDPNSVLTMMLNQEGSRLPSGPQFWGVRYVHWSLNKNAQFSSAPRIQNPQRLNFANRIELLGFSEGVADYLLLYWQALQPLDKNYSISLRLLDAEGEFWGALDRRPAGYNFPTNRWRAGEPVFGFNLAPALAGTPPGDYWLEVVAYDEETDSALDVLDASGAPQGQSGRVGPLRLRVIEPATPSNPVPAGTPVRLSGDVELLSWELDRTEAAPGEAVSVTAYWQTLRSVEAEHSAVVTLAGEDGRIVSEKEVILGNRDYPTVVWASGTPVRWVARLPVPAAARRGRYELSLGIKNAATGEPLGQSVRIAALEVKGFPRTWTAPQVEIPVGANLGGYAELYGAAVSPRALRPGESLSVTLYWHSKAAFQKSHTVFVHLIDKDSHIWAQQDLIPQNGERPTTSWLPGEYVADEYALPLPPDIPPGTYRIEVGLYDASTPAFARLPVLDAGGVAISDRVLLPTIEVR